MNRQLAATLIFLCCVTGATYASDGAATTASDTAAPPQAQATVIAPTTGRLISSAEAAPVVRRAATHADAAPRYASTRVAMPDAPPAAKREALADRSDKHSSTLWIVGLVLIAGIALRRWGSERA